MMDRTKPPPGFAPYLDGYMMPEHGDREHHSEGFDEFTLEEAWEFYDRITLPARVALLRELADELAGQAEARWSGWVYSADVADDIAKMLRECADKIEGK